MQTETAVQSVLPVASVMPQQPSVDGLKFAMRQVPHETASDAGGLVSVFIQAVPPVPPTPVPPPVPAVPGVPMVQLIGMTFIRLSPQMPSDTAIEMLVVPIALQVNVVAAALGPSAPVPAVEDVQ